MDLDWIWKAVVIVIFGTVLLRIAGRKSISQMTLAQTVIMIGIGSLLVQPVAEKNIWTTIGVGFILVLTLIVMEYAQIKSDSIEKFITGKSKVLIENGKIQDKQLKKLRMTIDQLEMNLRQYSITRIEDVEWATLEPNGRVAYSLKQDAQPVTKKEFKDLIKMIESTLNQQQSQLSEQIADINREQLPQKEQENLFAEVYRKGHKNDPPKHLQ